MDRRIYPGLRVLVVGQQKSFSHVLAANIQCWGHEAMVLPSMMTMCGEEIEGDVLLYDLDDAGSLATLMGGKDAPALGWPWATGDGVKGNEEQWPRTRLTIALSSQSLSRTALEQIGAVALLQKPFEMSQLQRYLRILQKLIFAREEAHPSGAKARILVVDDDVTITDTISKCLMLESKYEVAVAYDGLEALEQFLNWRPHCVVTDLIMPWMNGYQVMRCLATTQLYKIPAFVVISALHNLEVPMNRTYLQGKVVVYVNKPFTLDHLLITIEQVCKQSAKSSGY